MKNKINILLSSILAFGLLISCNEDDDATGASALDYSPATVTLSSSSPTSFSESDIDEDNASTYEIVITASVSEPQVVNAVINIVQSGGTATSDDYEAGTITIKAGDLTGSTTINILKTGDIEGMETLELTGTSPSNFNVSPFTFSATIEDDYVNDLLDLTLSWDGSAEDGDLKLESFCDVDFDLILYDSAFSSLGYVLGSSACPEHDTLSGLADGTYYLVADLWSNPYSGLGLTDTLPLTLTWSQEHFETSGSISSENYNLSSVGSDAGDGLGGLIVVLEVSNGYEYTLSPF